MGLQPANYEGFRSKLLGDPEVYKEYKELCKPRVKIWCDGSGTCACFVVDGEDPVVMSNLEGMTHNESEYYAIYLALEYWAWKLGSNRGNVEVLSDSLLAINQLNGKYKVKNPRLAKWHKLVKATIDVMDVKLTWIPREENEAGKVLE